MSDTIHIRADEDNSAAILRVQDFLKTQKMSMSKDTIANLMMANGIRSVLKKFEVPEADKTNPRKNN